VCVCVYVSGQRGICSYISAGAHEMAFGTLSPTYTHTYTHTHTHTHTHTYIHTHTHTYTHYIRIISVSLTHMYIPTHTLSLCRSLSVCLVYVCVCMGVYVCVYDRNHIRVRTNWYRQDIHDGRSRYSQPTQRYYSTMLSNCISTH